MSSMDKISKLETSKSSEKATDMEFAMFLSGHIKNPCEDLNGNNIRDFYIREAQQSLEKMQDEQAKEILRAVIRQYSNK